MKLNVTDLRLVGNAHPTIDKGFWRSPNAYFSAIRYEVREPKAPLSTGRKGDLIVKGA